MTTPTEEIVSISSIFATNNSFQSVRDAPPQERKLTNLFFFLAFIVCLVLLLPFSVVFTTNNNMKRLLYGYDSCGNTCGVKNRPFYSVNCSGKDMSEKPIAMMKYQLTNPNCIFSMKKVFPDKCVEKCSPPNQLIFNRCYQPETETSLDSRSKNFKQLIEIAHAICSSTSTIFTMSFTGLVLSFGLFVCLRCHVGATFWGLTIFQSFMALTAVAFFWHKYIINDSDNSTAYLFLALGAMAYFAFIFIFFFVLHNTFAMIRRIYQEASNAIFGTPMILLQPLLTLTLLISISVVIVFLAFLSLSTGCLKASYENPSIYVHVTNPASLYYIAYLVFIILWIYSFGEGLQAMVVSGATQEFYNTRDKFLRNPIRKSFQTLLNYHLGTVACGSLLSTIFVFMRGLAEYMNRKVYILTAMKGESFYKSLKRAITLLRLNLLETAAITGFNYLIISGFSFLIVIVTVGVGVWMNLNTEYTTNVRLGILFGAISASFVSHFVLQVLHTTTETIFISFCEERLTTTPKK
ncbi:LOW QUALITY PROTEIN: choline transporter-like protein 2 [Tribolium madens]|uniref:LOW QUALITY PROTEIN: choline transporter-like protein 2 n=1 Tax=Tribolium madens TaxID=41895 RepID=UPI001CF73B14|nr:LOW QUALITY PROTEIN: choline transporter-like protein 2 [Tribolium madens]